MIIRHSETNGNRHTEAALMDASAVDKFPNVGLRLRHFRKAAGYNQKDFAASIGIKPPSLSEIESGQSKAPAAITLLKAADVLNLDPLYLLTGAGSPFRSPQNLKPDELRLLLLYRELPDHQQHELEAEANRLHSLAHPVKSRLNPYPKKSKQPA